MTPYGAAARDYWDAGWSPLPLPHNAKDPVPTGFTGAGGQYVSERQLNEWLGPKGRAKAGNLIYRPGNVALRLPKNVIGIDVDAYGTKKGEETLAAAEEEWGPLPRTWVSTSRDDGISGIRLFRIPEGLEWPGELPQGKGVETLRWDHRYCIVAPSTNPQNQGLAYRWFREIEEDDGSVTMLPVPDEFPAPEDLPELPPAWVEGLTLGKTRRDRAVNEEMTGEEMGEWLECRPDPDKQCSTMRATVAKYTRLLRQASEDGGGHDSARDAAWAVLGDAKSGHCGVRAALTELRNVFLSAVRGRRADEGAARSEWRRAVERGIAKVSEDDNPLIDEDPCGSIKALRPKREGGGRLSSADIVYRFDDIGNAERLIRVMDGRARWVSTYKAWYLWTGEKWARDDDGQVERWAVKAVNQMSEEVAFLEGEGDEGVVKAFRAHIKSSGSDAKLQAMQRVARSRKGIILSAGDFDADPRLLACSNGTIELGDNGATFRPGRAEDYLTLNTGTVYRPDAKHALWDDYLKRFQPDEEVRDWLQRLVGYSLYGGNPDQLLIVGLGPTSTGKTTITEGLLAALGGYGGPLEASILRSNADDKPRPDILKAMPRRIVIAEELSEFQKLHVDQAKRITGAGTLSARGMAKDAFVERRAAFTPWLMTNQVPTIEGADAALRNRVLVVPFDVFQARTARVARIRERIITEGREAILAWAVEGWNRYVSGDTDLREIPAGALAANIKFQSELSDFHVFLSECCDVGAEYFEPANLLWEAYQTWCSQTGSERDQLSSNAFGRRLSQVGINADRISIDGRQTRVRVGARLTENYRRLVS